MSKKISISKAIGEALHEEMLRDPKVIIMGEDMGKMGNVFGITVGFQEEFGENRVIDTPISESGFCGMAVGAAMRGIRPVVELMYDDFITVAADPILNQAAKMRYMTGGQATVPMVLRLPMGAGRRNAGQHSQCLENMFCHTPGLKVIAPSTAEDAKGLLKSAIRDDDPVICMEHKLLYAKKEQIPEGEYLLMVMITALPILLQQSDRLESQILRIRVHLLKVKKRVQTVHPRMETAQMLIHLQTARMLQILPTVQKESHRMTH